MDEQATRPGSADESWWRPAESPGAEPYGSGSPAGGALELGVEGLGVEGGVKQPLLSPTAQLAGVTTETPLPFGIALLAGLGTALAGGLVWAGVVIATKYDIGILAWFVGASTGIVVARLSGGAAPIVGRAAAGLFAAGGIMVGKYVIFVHEVRAALAGLGAQIGYFDTRQMSLFVHNLTTIVRPIYLLWLGLAFFAAFRTAGGTSLRRRRL